MISRWGGRRSIERLLASSTLVAIAALASACAGAAGAPDDVPLHGDASDAHSSAETDAEDLEDSFVPAEFDTSTSDDASTDSTPADFTCPDDQYDVNADPSDGCEVTDDATNHTQATAFDLGPVDECDSKVGWTAYSGTIVSDARKHLPSGTLGLLGKPQWAKATHQYELTCANDPTLKLAINGGSGTYQVTLYRGDGSVDSCTPAQIGANAETADISCAKQSSGEVVYFKIEKVSGPPEVAFYTLRYHN
jgi:hypothetical protein